MTAKWITFRVLMVGLAVASLLAGASYLDQTDLVEANQKECQFGGILPNSIVVNSTSIQAGETSAHLVSFGVRLCSPAANTQKASPEPLLPSRISLHWPQQFVSTYSANPRTAGITLIRPGTDLSWDATSPVCGCGCYPDTQHTKAVAVELSPAELGQNLPGSDKTFLPLQFLVPESAELGNPIKPGVYRWEVALDYEYANQYRSFKDHGYQLIAAYSNGVIELNQTAGSPGELITISGHGFPPSELVQSIKVGEVSILRPTEKVYTDELGSFDFELPLPGNEAGEQVVSVEVSSTTAVAAIIVQGSAPVQSELDRRRDLSRQWIEELGDNLLSIFHYDAYNKCWTFYDQEVGLQGELMLFYPGRAYWVQVKEPTKVWLHDQSLNLTCASNGNCWNQIEW